MRALASLLGRPLAEPTVLVTVRATQGSAPREPGAWMAVFADAQVGSVGGGHLEWQALQTARAMLRTGEQEAQVQRLALGPTLGQCCGGTVQLLLQPMTVQQAQERTHSLTPPQAPLALFGGGHVGQALVRTLLELPFTLRWIDSRDEIFPSELAAQVACEHSDPVQAAVADLAPQSRVLVMSFSHAEDFEIVAACLQRQRARGDLPYVGLIGSRSKWASFQSRLRARGFGDAELRHITCPIGIDGISDKRPAVIAVAVAAQLLQVALDVTQEVKG